MPTQTPLILLKDKIELLKKKKKGSHFDFIEANSTAQERKQKRQKENKGDGGSRLTLEKTIQSKRLVGAVSEKRKRKKHRSNTGVRRVLPVRVGHRYFAKNSVPVQPRYRDSLRILIDI